MPIQGMLFDFDGTLGNTLPVCIAGMRRVIVEFLQRDYSDEQIMALFGPSEEGMIQRLIPPRHWDQAIQLFVETYASAHQECREPFPGIVEALEALKARGIALAIVTGKGPLSAEVSLSHLQLREHFDVIDTGSAEGAIKPRQIARVLAHWGLAPEHAAYVGDAPSDIDAAREAGVLALAAAWAKTADSLALGQKQPAALFESVADFQTWIARHLP